MARSPRLKWHPEDIKAEIRKRGWSCSSLSRSAGFCRQAVNQALTRPWFAVEQIISAAIDVPPETLWPERYVGIVSLRPSVRRPKKSKPTMRPVHRKSSTAA